MPHTPQRTKDHKPGDDAPEGEVLADVPVGLDSEVCPALLEAHDRGAAGRGCADDNADPPGVGAPQGHESLVEHKAADEMREAEDDEEEDQARIQGAAAAGREGREAAKAGVAVCRHPTGVCPVTLRSSTTYAQSS